MTVNYILSLFRKIGYDSTFWYREIIQNLLCLCKKKTQVVFSFFISSNFNFYLMNALVYVDIDQGIHKGKNESCLKWKTKKTTWVFFLYEYRKFWSISSEFKLELKTFILEVCEILRRPFSLEFEARFGFACFFFKW